MVIQRDLPVHVWGNAAPGEPVTVSFRGEARGAETDPLGHWSIYLKPGAAGGPFQTNRQGSADAAGPSAAPEQPITLDDIMVGDVWVASGQSNMEFPSEPRCHRSAGFAHCRKSANPAAHDPQAQLRLRHARRRHRWLDALHSRDRERILRRCLVLRPRHRHARARHCRRYRRHLGRHGWRVLGTPYRSR